MLNHKQVCFYLALVTDRSLRSTDGEDLHQRPEWLPLQQAIDALVFEEDKKTVLHLLKVAKLIL